MTVRGRAGWWVAGALVGAVTLGLTLARSAAQDAAQGAGPNGLGLTFRPMPSWFKFRPAAEIETWIQENDAKSITQHAWELWGGLTSPTTETVDGKSVTYPIFETWVDESTVFPSPTASPAAEVARRGPGRPFTLPKQFLHSPLERARLREQSATAARSLPTIPMVVSVKYTQEMYDHVRANKYYDPFVMASLTASWTSKTPPTPIRDRSIKPFPDKSIMLKPTYQIVSGRAATAVPYWTGPADSTTPSTPGPKTWTKSMWVIPPGVAAPQAPALPAVPIERFYNFRLNAQEAAYINGLGQGTFQEGDYAILVAMHVSSREIDDWTWQTFWWSFDKPKVPTEVATHVLPPFDNYQLAVGYSFTEGPDSPSGLNVVCYSPYLEAGFDNGTFVKPGQLGIESNCMSCHRAAVWPVAHPFQTNYIANGIIDPGDPFFFQGVTKTDFVWGLGSDIPMPPPNAPVNAAPTGVAPPPGR